MTSSTPLVKGVQASQWQVATAKGVLDEAKKQNVSQAVIMQALMFACIMESGMGTSDSPAGAAYQGPLAGQWSYFSQFGTQKSAAVLVQQVDDFIHGGHGYTSAISQAHQFTDPGKLAAAVERPTTGSGGLGPAGYGQYYNQVGPGGVTGQKYMNLIISEAAQWVQRYGAGGLTGSTAGTSQGSSKSSTSAFFYVGGPQNTSEDVWTAVNRLSQQRYWYLFSDGESVYLADGSVLMQQPPAATVDRWNDLDKIVSLSFNWDNTAWQYAANVKKRKKVVRKTQLTKISSPVEAQLDLVCDIDAVRAGDVVALSGCGPGDGKWMVGTARRSIFDIYSELDLVPAVKALTEAQAEISIGALSNADVPGAAGGKTAGVVINALWTACVHITTEQLHYVSYGGRAQAGHPDAGRPGEGFYDGKTQGYDAVGCVAAVLAAAGFAGGAVPNEVGLVQSLLKPKSGPPILNTGRGSGIPEFSIFLDQNLKYFFIYINAFGTGSYWGSSDGADSPNVQLLTQLHTGASEPVRPGQPFSVGGTFLNPPPASVMQGLVPYHIPQNILGDRLNNAQFGGVSGNYVNPFKNASNLSPERIDMGVDYNASAGSPILAIGNCTILAAASSGTGWTSPENTQAGVYYRLSDGSFQGKTIYVTEDIIPSVHTGDTVPAGAKIATFKASPTGLETGWGSGTPYGSLAASLNQIPTYGDPGAWSSAAGISFNNFLRSLGAPGGQQVGSGQHGSPMPAGYP